MSKTVKRGSLGLLFLALAVRSNISLAALGRLTRFGLFVDEAAEAAMVERFRASLNIRMASPDQLIANLSGGNQQKVVLARWLALEPKILIVDEPTRGIDVAGKQEIMNLLVKLAADGMALVFISAEVEELLRVSSRIIVMRDREQVGELPGGCSEDEVYALIAAPADGGAAPGTAA